MKYRSPKTGEVFEYQGIPDQIITGVLKQMGYEIIEAEEENNMEKKDKPRLAEVLGVEVGEKFRVYGAAGEFWVESDGGVKTSWAKLVNPPMTTYILYAINHPESIIRAPRLTEAELRIMQDCGARWVSRSGSSATDDCKYVKLWEAKPQKNSFGKWEETIHLDAHLTVIDARKFPSVQFGDCICVEEVTSHDS